MTTTPRRILVVGGGPAGATSAYWLARAGFEVTVAERSTEKFAYGQGIDITGPALEIVGKMGVLGTIKEKMTGEGGFAILDDNSNIIAQVGAGEGISLTQEIEIMRGDLTKLLADAANASDKVTYRYGSTVMEIQQNKDGVNVVLSDNKDGKSEQYLAIIGADGQNSKTRQMIFDRNVTKDSYKGLKQYTAYFSLDGRPEDTPNSRLQQAPGRRAILIRPVDAKAGSCTKSSCYMVYTNENERIKQAMGQSAIEQKAVLASLFEDFPGPMARRAIQGLQDTKDFYMSETAQIKLPKWSSGRCALVGDAAYAPSPVTGQGTALAILGSYLIAGELASNPDDSELAFAKYEERLRGYVTQAQNLPLDGKVVRLVNPETYTGIRILRFVFWFVAWSGIWKWFDFKDKNKFDLPEYSQFD